MLHCLLLASLLAVPGPLPAASAEGALQPSARVMHPALNEISGIVKSRRYPDTYWVHNDSGDEARIFAIHGDGSMVIPPWEQKKYFGAAPEGGKAAYPGLQVASAVNIDWEDITLDGDTLYITDMGNNGNARRDLGVYVLPEPNPAATMRSRPLKWLPVEYPAQTGFPSADWHYDCEAVFVFKGSLHFLTKHRALGQYSVPEANSDLYRLDSAYTDRPNVLKKVDSHPDLQGWVTGAALSPDGKTLAVLCEGPVKGAWLFSTPSSGSKLLSGPARRLLLPGTGQCEAICFVDNDSLLVANEGREIFSLKTSDFGPVTR